MERTGNILSAIFDSFDDVWFLVAPDYSIIFFNKKAADNSKLLHGKELKAGDNILDYARDTQNNIDEKFLKLFDRACQGEIIKSEEHIQYNSTSIWIRSKYTPVYEQDTLLGVSIINEDISTQKQFEEERRKQQEEILALSNKREEFVNIASHELKTPLTSLKASIQIISKLIDKGASQQEIRAFLEKSSLSIIKLTNLIKHLLDTNKITTGSLVLNKSWFNMAELIESCCDHIRMEGKHEVHLKGDRLVNVFADREKIDQVIVNLVNNAAKYAPSSVNIIVTVEKNNEILKISVQDFGPGIPKEKIENLFKRYYQADHSQHTSTGMGLGLYIADGIIKQHGGDIGVSSNFAEGSIFWFTLPA